MENLENIKNEIVEGAAQKAEASLNETVENVKSELSNEMKSMQKSIDDFVTAQKNATFGIAKKRSEFETKFNDAISDCKNSGRGTLELDSKTFTAGAGPDGQIYRDERVADIKYDPNFQNRLRNVLATGTTSGGSVRYNQETASTPNAGSKAKGASQTAAVKTITDRQIPIQTLSIFHTLPEEWLDDVNMLESYFSNRFMGDLMDAEDLNILRGNPGSGSAGSLTAATAYEGLNSNSRAFADAAARETYVGSLADQFGTAANLFDVLGAVKAGMANENYKADCVILNPIDIATLVLLKSTQGEYVLRQTVTPAGSVEMFWNGMKVIETPAQQAGRFTILDSKKATQYWMREGLNIQFDRNGSDFQTNSISIRGIIRGNVTNYLPNGIVSDTIANFQAALNA